MARQPSPPAPEIAALAAEIARLRKRVERLERAQAVRPGPVPGTAQRNSALTKSAPGLLIEPGEPWNLRPPGLRGRGK